MQAIESNDIVFGVGPAGTGKTYLAMAMAVARCSAQRVKRIVLTRPAVEAGEKLGFLPGDMAEKVDPYLRPLYDALHDMLPAQRVYSLIQRGTIEVAPLAFMRGRTLNDSFVILDEAQNTTDRADAHVPDPPRPAQQGRDHRRRDAGRPAAGHGSGLATRGCSRHQGSCCCFSSADVVRHPLVQRIVDAYEPRCASARRARWR